jgi:hypothetical protein
MSMDAGRPENRIILVYDADSGLRAMLLDVVKKAAGKEDCALCEITYSPLGKREAWRRCEKSFGMRVEELHRDQLPPAWGISRGQLPCILLRGLDGPPIMLVSKDAISACRGSVEALERAVRSALSARDMAG